MADIKLNVLHLHLSDDEAWRVEIPGLPALTGMGARRGYTLTETECLYPMYCGGWDYTDMHSMANGFLTREDYISLLKYAADRHIRVIPEVDMPGHMRACKKALHPLLSDSVLDARSYYGAQEYTDNVIAVTKPYALTFIETVVSEFAKMYEEAGCPFLIFNIGGDEVPEGALTNEEHQAFINGVLDILRRYNLQPMGWEEITGFCPPESRAICYSWHNGMELPLQMAEAGYPVVLATANHLYFDFAYCRHHEERGLEWGGFTDEFRSFDWEPLQHPNIIGLNAQLWAECLRSFAQVEWQLFPKMYGLSERAWNTRSALSLADYTGLVYETLLPVLHQQNHNFHLQLPGIRLENTENGRLVSMNKVMQGGDIIYTLDGSSWQTYTEPFVLPDDYTGIVKARVRYLNHESGTTWHHLK
jgi:hexosaminidase